MAAKQGFLMYYSKGDAIGTKVSVRYRRSGRLSGVVVKRGSTVYRYPHNNYYFSLYTNSTCISPFLGSIIPISLFIKYFFILYIYIEDRNLNLKSNK